MASVVLLVVLRVSLGFHFLYEGVWKIAHPEFTAEPFLTEAKGPAAEIFYAMVPDIKGRDRLTVREDEDGVKVSSNVTVERWTELLDRVKHRFALSPDQEKAADKELQQATAMLSNYLNGNAEEIRGYFISLANWEERKAEGGNGTDTEKKRVWDKQKELRAQLNGWITEIEAIEAHYHQGLLDVLTEEQREASNLPVAWTQMDFMNLMVSYSLSAIGLCLIIGLCTRLAALGGGAFMIMIVLTQPGWPTIYPPAPPVVGHSLLVNKDFVEMVALFTLATFPAGRWGGLDFFLYHFVGRRLEGWFGIGAEKDAETA